MLKHIVTLILAVALGALAPMAEAQQPPPPAASAADTFTPTPDTACGAAGSGYALRYLPGANRRERVPLTRPADTAARPGAWSKRVNASHEWEACRMPPRAKDCQPRAVEPWQFQGAICAAAPGTMLPARHISPVDVRVTSQGYLAANPAPGQRRGYLIYECRREGWVLLQQWCE